MEDLGRFGWRIFLDCVDRDEQMSNGYPFFLLSNKPMSNKVGVQHQPDFLWGVFAQRWDVDENWGDLFF